MIQPSFPFHGFQFRLSFNHGSRSPKIVSLSLLALIFLLTSCAGLPAVLPEPSPPPSATNTSAPTLTTPPTLSPHLGQERTFPDGGFALRLPLGLEGNPQAAHITLTDPGQTIVFFVMGSKTNPRGLNNAELLEYALLMFFTGNDDSFTTGDANPATIAGVDGFTTTLSGKLLKETIQGRAFVTQKEDGQFLFGFGFANLGKDANLWLNSGEDRFQAMLQSARFLQPEETFIPGTPPGINRSDCRPTTDPTYGYSESNPIKVGGGSSGGMTHAEAYFHRLATPNGQPIPFDHSGTTSGASPLEIFIVTVDGRPVQLFVDVNSPMEFLAPVGFTCLADPPQDSL